MGIEEPPDGSEERGDEDASSPGGQVHDASAEAEQPSTHVTRVAKSASENFARMERPAWLEQNERISKIVSEATRPKMLESIQRTSKLIESIARPQSLASSHLSAFDSASNLLAGDTFKNVGLSSALGGDLFKPQSAIMEAIARSTTERAGFSLASGLEVSDSVSSMFSKLVSDTAGVGLASSVLSDMATNIEGPAIAKLGAGATAGLSKSLVAQFSSQSLRITRAISTQHLAATSGIANLIATDKLMGSWRQTLLAETTARSLGRVSHMGGD